MLWFSLLILMAVGAGMGYAWFGKPRPGKAASPAKPVAAEETRKAWGKQLHVPDPTKACMAARVLNGSEFVMGSVPALPLQECGNQACLCRFVPLFDRRSALERRNSRERREQIRIDSTADRRKGIDRRDRGSYHWAKAT